MAARLLVFHFVFALAAVFGQDTSPQVKGEKRKTKK